MPELGPSGSVRGRPAMGVPTAIRRASLEKDDVQADPTTFRGRLIRLGETSEDDAQSLHRGTGGSTYMKESARNTGSPMAWSGMTNRTPARERPGAMGWRRGS